MNAHVAIFAHNLGANGVARNAVAIAEHLGASGICTDLVIADTANARFSPKPAASVRLVSLNKNSTIKSSRITEILQTAHTLHKYLKREKPDLMLSMGNHAHFSAWLGSRGYNGLHTYRISNDIVRRAGITSSTKTSKGILRNIVTKLISRDAHHLFLVSQTLLASKPLNQAAHEKRVTVVPNGVDYEHAKQLAAAPCPHTWLEDTIPVILAIGRLHPSKNLDTLIHAFSRVLDKQPARLIILGDGLPKQRRALENLSRTLDCQPYIDLAGLTDNTYAYLSRAAVFALPSWNEGTSNALLEALACGTPIVASHSAGNAQHVLGHGAYGLLFDPCDENALAEAILKQLSSSAVYPGNRVRTYDLKMALEQYEERIRALLSCPHK